jgi:hypothetical protein
MKNRTAKKTTVYPNTQGNNKKVIAGSPRPVSKMEKVTGPPKDMSGNSSRMTNYTTPGPSLQAMQQQIEMDRLNSIPFKNNAVELFDRRRYGIPMEVDGQEMDGMLMERPTVDDQVQPVRRVTKDKKIN